jgi:hypothetical protein
MFQLVRRRRRGGSGADGSDTAYSRWRKILPVLPSKSLPGEAAKECEVNADDKDSVTAVSNGDLKNDCNRTGKWQAFAASQLWSCVCFHCLYDSRLDPSSILKAVHIQSFPGS